MTSTGSSHTPLVRILIQEQMSPRMFVVAGPPGSGKSTAFPVSGFGVDCFNADDTAAELTGGSYLAIPQPVRDEVNRRFQSFSTT